MTLVARPLEAPVEPTTRRLPSEALRLGRLYRPVQISGAMFGDEKEACALGAMIVGSGGDTDDSYDFLSTQHPGLVRTVVDCPYLVCVSPPGPHLALDMVYHLNDEHLWLDDQIVGWLQGYGL